MRRLTVLCLAALLGLPAAVEAQQAPRRAYDFRNLAFQGIGVEVGWILPARTESAGILGARADLGLLGPGLRIVPRMAFWSSKLKESEVRGLAEQIEEICDRQAECPPFDLGEVRISDLLLGVDAHVVWETALGVDTYAGVGGNVHLLNGQGQAIDDTFVEDLLDAITPGVDLVAGAELPIGPLRVFGEGRAVLASDTRWLGLSVGGSFAFAAPAPAPARVPDPSPPASGTP